MHREITIDAVSFSTRPSPRSRRPRGLGVRLAYHHHMGTVVETAEEVDRLVAATGEAVGLLMDTGHLTYAGTAVRRGEAQRERGAAVSQSCGVLPPFKSSWLGRPPARLSRAPASTSAPAGRSRWPGG